MKAPKLVSKDLIYIFLTFASLFSIWEIIVQLNLVESLFLPKPSLVFSVLIKNFKDFLPDILITLKRISQSYVIGGLLGTLFGLLCGWYKNLERTVGGVLNAIFPIPRVTFLPLFILWFGIGETTVIISGVFAVFFGVYITVFSGTKKIDKGYIEVFKNLKGKQGQIFQKVIFPASLPYITTGLRHALGKVLGSVIVVEMLVAQEGLGSILWRAANLFKPELIVVNQVIIGILAILLFWFFDRAEKNALPWIKEIEK